MPRWKELKRFCERDHWELYKDTDHYYYRKIDENGNIRMTKVSKGSGEIHPHMWREILKKQLQVSQDYFNSKIQDGKEPYLLPFPALDKMHEKKGQEKIFSILF